MMNQVELIDRLGDNPTLRDLKNGERVYVIRLATSESWKDADGERKNRTTWHTVEVFGKGKVNAIEKSLKKGSLVHIEGQLRYDEFETDGIKQVRAKITISGPRHHILFLDKKPAEQAHEEAND
jgi:single-strand DNA-binding protein